MSLIWLTAPDGEVASLILQRGLGAIFLNLPGGNPFPDRPPVFVRARRFRYRFSTWRELRDDGACWVREPIGDYLPPMRLRR